MMNKFFAFLTLCSIASYGDSTANSATADDSEQLEAVEWLYRENIEDFLDEYCWQQMQKNYLAGALCDSKENLAYFSRQVKSRFDKDALEHLVETRRKILKLRETRERKRVEKGSQALAPQEILNIRNALRLQKLIGALKDPNTEQTQFVLEAIEEHGDSLVLARSKVNLDFHTDLPGMFVSKKEILAHPELSEFDRTDSSNSYFFTEGPLKGWHIEVNFSTYGFTTSLGLNSFFEWTLKKGEPEPRQAVLRYVFLPTLLVAILYSCGCFGSMAEFFHIPNEA